MLVRKTPHGHWSTTTFLAALPDDRIDVIWTTATVLLDQFPPDQRAALIRPVGYGQARG